MTNASKVTEGSEAQALGSGAMARLNKNQAATYLGVTPRTLDRWYTLSEGPPRLKIGARVYYFRESLDAWIKAQEVIPLCGEGQPDD